MSHTCSRCQNKFEGEIQDKTLSHLTLSPAISAYLQKSFYTCLCQECVQAVEELENLSQQYPFPKQPNQLINGVHFYIEGSYWVFTPLYHYQKGKCCQNGCRHCAYGYKK